MEFTLAPVLEDHELSAVLQRARQPSASAAAHTVDVPPETSSEDAPVAPKQPLERPNHLTTNSRERTRCQGGGGLDPCVWGGDSTLTPRRLHRQVSGAYGSGHHSGLRLKAGCGARAGSSDRGDCADDPSSESAVHSANRW